MTTANDIITQAFREGNFIPIGKTPDADQKAEALPRLNRFLSSLFGHEIGAQVIDWPVPPSVKAPVHARYPRHPRDETLGDSVWPYPPANVALHVDVSSQTTVYFPKDPHDGARIFYADLGSSANLILDGNGKLIQSAATQTITPGTSAKKWFYRADLGDWIELKTLAEGDTMPLPEEFDDLFVTGLAIRLAPRFEVLTDEETLLTFRSSLKRVKARYAQPTKHLTNIDFVDRRLSDINSGVA